MVYIACVCSAPEKIDFTNLPEVPEIVLGTRKQTCLASTASRAPVKLLPEPQQYEVCLMTSWLQMTAISLLLPWMSHCPEYAASDLQ